MDYIYLIKELRKKAFLSQTELSQILGISFTTVNRWENGKFEPTIKTKKRLNDLFIQYKIIDENSK